MTGAGGSEENPRRENDGVSEEGACGAAGEGACGIEGFSAQFDAGSPSADDARPVRAAPSPSAGKPSTLRRLAALAVPTFGQLIAEPTFVLIDTAIVGHVGTSALAGLSIGSTVILTAAGLCIFLAYATTSRVARLLGAGKRREGLQAGMGGLWLALFIGIALAAALFAFAEPVCWALGGRGDVLDQAVAYARAVVLGAPGMLLVYAANGVFRGLQKVGVTLAAAVAGAVVNTVLDVAFVIGLGWGVAGSGVATCIAQWAMGLFLAVPVLRWAAREGVGVLPRRADIAAAGGDGLPLFVRTLALRAALVATVMAAASLGADVLAGYQAVNAAWNFSVNALDAVAIAGQTLVGAQLGAGNAAEARRLVRATARAGAVLGVAVGVAFVCAGAFAGGVFSPDAQVQAVIALGMGVMGVFMPLQGWLWALDGILIGAGDFRYLARACCIVAACHIAALAVASFVVAPALPGNLARCALLWAVFNVFFIGGRAVANALRARSDVWMAVR